MSELQPGMLALIVGCRVNPVLIGSIVTLVKIVIPGERFREKVFVGSYPCWVVEGEGLVYSKPSGSLVEGDFSYVAPRHLMPIKPEADPLHVTHKEELHA